MRSALPRWTLLFLGEWGQARGGFCRGVSHRPPPARSRVGGWWQQEADKRHLWCRGSLQPEWAPSFSGPTERSPRKLPTPFAPSPLRCW